MLVRFPWRRSMLGDGEPSAREESKTTLSLQGMASDLKVTWAKRHWQAKMQIVVLSLRNLILGNVKEPDMGLQSWWLLAIIFGCSVLSFAQSDCPARPA